MYVPIGSLLQKGKEMCLYSSLLPEFRKMLALYQSAENDLPEGHPLRGLHIQFYMVIISSGFDTKADGVLVNTLPRLASAFPLESCFILHLIEPKEVWEFKTQQNLMGTSGPLIFISEENPLLEEPTRKRAVIRLGRLSDEDEIKKVLVTLSEQARDPNFIRKVRAGEAIRAIEQALREYGGAISKCLAYVGIG